ncbi:zinc finger protein 385A isoform X1 [Tachysurus ichikawai]
MIQPHLDMKTFLQFPMETPPPHSVGLFHNFNTMDPVQKAVINHTFGVPLVKTKRPIISCNVCQIRFNSETDNPLSALEGFDYRNPAIYSFVIANYSPQPVILDKEKWPDFTPICVQCCHTDELGSCQSQAEAHYKGNRHARRVKGIETSKTRPQESDKPPPGPTSSPSPLGAPTANTDTDSSKTGDD